MTVRMLTVMICGLGLGVAAHELHAQTTPEAKATTPAEMQWGAQGGLAMAGMKQLNLVGNPSEPANVAHFVEVREPVTIQVSGTGPSGRAFVNPAGSAK